LYYLYRDAQSYAKYSVVDLEIDQKACQDLISGESVIAKGMKIMFEDPIKEHRASLASDEVNVVVIFFSSLF
jgi:hypothetical protein